MNILITRPLIDSEDLMGKLFSLGHKIVHIPTLKISAANITLIDAQKYDAFIFTSANAIRNLKLNNQDTNKVCFCVGSITEKIVRQKGYNNTISAGGTVNALKNIILILAAISIFIFKKTVIKQNINEFIIIFGFSINAALFFLSSFNWGMVFLSLEFLGICTYCLLGLLKKSGWKKLEVFQPGEELEKLKD